MSLFRRTLIALLLIALPQAAVAEPGRPLDVADAFALSARATPSGALTLNWRIADGTYLYRDRITLETADGRPVPIETPEGEPKDDPYFGRLEVYHDAAAATVSARALAAVPKGETLSLTYQGCQDGGICYRPQTRDVDPANPAALGAPEAADGAAATLGRLAQASRVSEPSSPWAQAPSASASGGSASSSAPEDDAADASDAASAGDLRTVSNLPAAAEAGSASSARSVGITLAPSTSLVDGLLGEGGSLWAVAVFFALGLGLAFTPCVLPMYPILAGQLTRSGERPSLARGFTLSATYVLAMAFAFAIIGFAAAWSGQNLQMALQSQSAILLVSVLFVVLALSMLGLFELRLPAAWTNAVAGLPSPRRGSLAASAGLGFTSTLIVGPCMTAPLAGGLLYIARTGDVGLGTGALFALGLGQGVPLIVFGTLGVRALPRPGPWMTRVTQGFGFAFLALALWMVSRILPDAAVLVLWSALLIGAGVFIGALDVLSPDSGPRRRLAKATGLIAILYGAILALGAAAGGSDPLRPLAQIASAKVALEASPQFRPVASAAEVANSLKDTDRPSLIYVTAEWCVSCNVIKRDVFPDPDVRARMALMQLLEVDVTDAGQSRDRLMRDLAVAGPPTMLFLDRNGREAPGSRLIGDVSPQQFIAAADRAGGRS
ncbi:protein-disulfide reductase DsbD [Jiella pacifica]|uniref:Protein-disulfide reductase DsbD n=1 Tax=Jiella pacifica TaxID=2696469 RepID=A0A6N9T951_9HYPH|nr:protein-disulfide reductase DsbD [Jiella pacifica]NDW06576.1 protein-disulfide reductase DsbD [Jiella pacifica]